MPTNILDPIRTKILPVTSFQNNHKILKQKHKSEWKIPVNDKNMSITWSLFKLMRYKDLIFVKADKGNWTVPANRGDHDKKIENIPKNDILYKNKYCSKQLKINVRIWLLDGKTKD